MRSAAPTVAHNIIHGSVPISPVRDGLRRQGQQQCYELLVSTLLGHSSLNSDLEDSVKRLTRVHCDTTFSGVSSVCSELFAGEDSGDDAPI